MQRNSSVVIKTAEGIVFDLPLAGPIARFLAWVIDFACILVITTAIGTALRFVAFLSNDAANALSMIAFFLVSFGYGIFCEWRFKGQTVGKGLLGMRVLDAEGLGLQPGQVVVRNLLRVIDLLPLCYLVGGVASLVSPRCQRLGDMAANTIVIRDERVVRPDLQQLNRPMYNTLRMYPHLAARLRTRVTQREADIAVEALLRRDDLEPLARVRLFAELAGYLKGLVTLPAEISEGLADEQFVRNVVDVLFAARP
jgi:uncharacterized RDD family membrane protein YckC